MNEIKAVNKNIKECLILFYNFVIQNKIMCRLEPVNNYEIIKFNLTETNGKEILIIFCNDLIRIIDAESTVTGFINNIERRYDSSQEFIYYLNHELCQDLMRINYNNNENFCKEFIISFKLAKYVLSHCDKMVLNRGTNDMIFNLGIRDRLSKYLGTKGPVDPLLFKRNSPIKEFGILEIRFALLVDNFNFSSKFVVHNDVTGKVSIYEFGFEKKFLLDEFTDTTILKMIEETIL